MDLPNILNTKGSKASVVAAEQQHLHQFADPSHMNGRHLSDNGSERGMSPHMTDPSRFPSRQLHGMQNMANAPRYTESTHLQQQFSMMPNPYPTPTASLDNGYSNQHQTDDQIGQPQVSNNGVEPPAKAFPCSNCGKGFARRSDLARHERIHTGVRPHVCDHPGCGKQFIQRSALTVHARVHTGEKPHMCEHCTKPFSDSSSLARHRRIHSGKRPYKCPYADCQKTFTRRTTLTRHQSHHTGTVEEAAAATAAALASRPANNVQRTRSDGGTFSETGSARTTPSPGHRDMSMSPSSDMPQVAMLPRQHGDFSYMSAAGSIPPHLRGDMSHHSPRSGSTSPALSAFGGSHSRPSLTSHPAMYGPPPTLEPPTHNENRGTGSANGSPHLSSMGWQSPSNQGMSPIPNEFIYPEPPYVQAQHLYYPNSHIRRPQSTEPDQYETKPRLVSGEVWAGTL